MGKIYQIPNTYWQREGATYITPIRDYLISSDSFVLVDNTEVASSSNAGKLRYRKSGDNTYIDVCMQVGASDYEWINIQEINF
jgi:hypothetical protein